LQQCALESPLLDFCCVFYVCACNQVRLSAQRINLSITNEGRGSITGVQASDQLHRLHSKGRATQLDGQQPATAGCHALPYCRYSTRQCRCCCVVAASAHTAAARTAAQAGWQHGEVHDHTQQLLTCSILGLEGHIVIALWRFGFGLCLGLNPKP